jgi:hypothetical protein
MKPIQLLQGFSALTLAIFALAASAANAQAKVVTSTSFGVHAMENSLATATQDATPLDTGLVFSTGDLLSVSAAGNWSAGCSVSYGPDGAAGTGFACGGPLADPTTGLSMFSLIGRTGSGPWFEVGSNFNSTVTTSGHLYLAFLDSDSSNNSGLVAALVSGGVPAVPEPSTKALLLAAAGAGLIAVRRRKAFSV